jgi:hypothetical protein
MIIPDILAPELHARPPSGTGILPVIELPKAAVASSRRIRIRRDSKRRADVQSSLGNFTGSLGFDAWRFFHAAKKTEFTRSFTAQYADRKALAFAVEHENVLVWNTPNLRRCDRSVFDLEDFGASHLAGRFGEAAAYLLMVDKGYVYWDRICVLWERAAQRANITHPEMTARVRALAKAGQARPQGLQADFAFEKADRTIALMEAKGSFVNPDGDSPTYKTDLQFALRQLAAWVPRLDPQPKEWYAIGTYLREQSDASPDPSLVAYVVDGYGDDPPAKSGAVPIPDDGVRRGNYSSWIDGMGFPDAAAALRNRRRYDGPGVNIPVVDVAGRRFAVVPQFAYRKRPPQFGKRYWRRMDPFFDFMPWWGDPMLWDVAGIRGILVLGLDVNVLNRIVNVLRDPADTGLLQIPISESVVGVGVRPGFEGSIMPDGSLVGMFGRDDFMNSGEETFLL